MADVTMPQLGETVTEGTITRWMKAVGEQVDRDEPLFEVSTDKVDSEVPSPASGVLSEILVPEGETVEVGARLAVIADGAQAPAAPPAGAGAGAAPPAAPEASLSGVATAAVPGLPVPEQAPGPLPQGPAAPPEQPMQAPSSQPPAAAPAAQVSPFAAPPPPVAPSPGPVPAAPAYAPPPPPPPSGYISRPEGAAPAAGPAPFVAQGPAGGAEVAAPEAPEMAQAGEPLEPAGAADARLLSPVVRRLLEDNGISPSDVTGTGLGGRITREDVLALLDARHAGPAGGTATAGGGPVAPPPGTFAPQPAAGAAGQPSPSAAGVMPSPAPSPGVAPPFGAIAAASTAGTAVMRPVGDRVVPFSNMRRRTAEHMVRSKATSPHAFIAYEADFENVERVRKAWGPRFVAEEGFSLTYLPFIARASVEALREFPNLNSSVIDDSLVVHQQINLGVAVDLQHEGLIVPVVHRAEEVTLRGIARRVRDLAERARARQLTADDIASGTFSITNDGPFGTYFTVPIINQPQVAILSTDGIRRRPIVVELPDGSESLAIHSVGIIGMSWDHRAVDGAYVSSYLRRVAELLATRDWVAEL